MDKQEAEKNPSLRNEKLKANRATETQKKERLRIRREKDRARWRTTLKRLKRGDEEI